MSTPGPGYHVDPGGLDSLVSDLHGGADAFNGLAALAPAAPDCGASTELVAKALAKFVGASAALSGVLADTAGKIHRANGSYGDTENVVKNVIGGMHGPK